MFLLNCITILVYNIIYLLNLDLNVFQTYCKDLLALFKEKHEAYVLKIWKHTVNALGKVNIQILKFC